MKRKIAYTFITLALVMSAFLIGKPMSTQKIVEPKPNAKQYLAVKDIDSIDYYASENKLTISTSTDSYDFEPNVNVIPSETETDNICQLYDSSELTEDILANRQGKLIIEKCVGTVTDDEKNGSLEDGSYISYESVNCTKGDTIVTYLIYNPETNYTDDVIERFDTYRRENK